MFSFSSATSYPISFLSNNTGANSEQQSENTQWIIVQTEKPNWSISKQVEFSPNIMQNQPFIQTVDNVSANVLSSKLDFNFYSSKSDPSSPISVGPSSPAATTSQSSLSCLFQSQSEQIEKLRKISFQSQSEVNFVGHRFTVDKEKLKSTSRVELKSISQSSHHSIRHILQMDVFREETSFCDAELESSLRMVKLPVKVSNASDFGNQHRSPFGFDYEVTSPLFQELTTYLSCGGKLFFRVYCSDENEQVVSYDSEPFSMEQNFYVDESHQKKSHSQMVKNREGKAKWQIDQLESNQIFEDTSDDEISTILKRNFDIIVPVNNSQNQSNKRQKLA